MSDAASPASLLAELPYLARLTLQLQTEVNSLRTISHSLELRMAEMGVGTLKADITDLCNTVKEHEKIINEAKGSLRTAHIVWGILFATLMAFVSWRLSKL